MRKGEIARYEQFLVFPQNFQETCTGDMSFSQAKDTKVVPLAAHLFKNRSSAAPFHWIRSKPIASNQTIRNKKSSAKQKTIMASPAKNESCRVCEEILRKIE